MSLKDEEERQAFRDMQKEIHAGIFGSEKLGYTGLIKDVAVIGDRQESHFKLLLPNRILFFICKRPVYLVLIFMALGATVYGMSYPDVIKLGLAAIGIR